jgi:hypothetical protein
MPQDVSTAAGEKPHPKPKKRQLLFRSSPKVAAIIQRLRYAGEHIFGGDLDAYGAAVGFSKFWMTRILNPTARLRLSTFTQFVESGVVRAEWLFCGTGPMTNEFEAESGGVFAVTSALTHNNPYALFDTTLVDPFVFDSVDAIPAPVTFTDAALDPAFIPAATAIFQAHSANQPVILAVEQDVLRAGCGRLVCEFMRRKLVNAVVLSGVAAELDLQLRPPAVANILRQAATAKLGAGEAFGRWGITDTARRESSILATAYDCSFPAFVRISIGEMLASVTPALYGVNFGAVLGTVAYIDTLALYEVFRLSTLGRTPGVCIVAGADVSSMRNTLKTALTVCRAVPHTDGTRPILIGLTNDLTKSWTYAYSGEYRDVFTQLNSACAEVYKGVLQNVTNDNRSKRGKTNNNRRFK